MPYAASGDSKYFTALPPEQVTSRIRFAGGPLVGLPLGGRPSPCCAESSSAEAEAGDHPVGHRKAAVACSLGVGQVVERDAP